MSKLLEQINNEKKIFRLGDLVGINERSLMSSFQYSEIEYLDTSSVTENRFDKPEILNIKDAPSRAKRLVKDGDTIISTVRPNLKHYGFIKNPEKNTVASTGFAVLTPKAIDPFYLFSYLTRDSVTNTLAVIAEATTTTFPAFRPEVLADMEIEIPNLQTQKKVASILGAYDKKIENNNKIIKNLETTAQTIFNEWFVNFKFPGYEKVKMIDSEMGEIPEGWEVGKIKNLIKIESGFAFKSDSFNKNGKYKLVTIRNVQDGEFISDSENKILDLPQKLPEYCKLKTSDILLSLTGNVGRVCIVIGDNYVLNQRVSNLVPIEEFNRAFTYFLFRGKEFQNLLISLAKGSAQPNLSPIDTKNIETLIPNKHTLSLFSEKVGAFFVKIIKLKEENISLKSHRDLLLAKLI